MEYLNLPQIKSHLNIDIDYTMDDLYIESLGDVVEAMVEKHLGYDLHCLDTEEGILPAPITHAMLLLLGNFYNNRESVQSRNFYQLPLAYNYLLQLYKNYDYEIKPVIKDEPIEDEPIEDEPVEDEPIEDEPIEDEPNIDE